MQTICSSSHGRLCFNHYHTLSKFISPSSSPSLLPQRCYSFCIPKLGATTENGRGRSVVTVKASGEEVSNENFAPLAPVELESPVGQLLMQILTTHPHLLPVTVDEQLEKFAIENKNPKPESSSSQDILSKRISEVRDKDRRKTLGEIIYCLVVQRFVEKGISMIPRIKPTSDPTGRIDLWPNQEEKLEVIHSADAFEMIQSHLSSVLGDDRTAVGPLSSIIQISKIKLGKLYAASAMYGYFLRRVDQRYQLERTMKTLPKRPEKTRERFEEPSPPYPLWDPDSLIRIQPEEYDPDEYAIGRNEDESSSYGLRSYVTYLDSDTLQRYATLRSKEAMTLIEKQTQALFGRPDIRILEDGKLDTSNDEVLSLSVSGLAMLVLEAVAFGSFLWDSESYVESKYHFLKA
ncbi:UV-B-induced protein [Cardamine amara subsp. amara]|uniref:UV-B-induced protein n=1 Tax=Cardamine amara subsp. amara TaxID=228776 RepID=A0ABD0ZYG4_CARAN